MNPLALPVIIDIAIILGIVALTLLTIGLAMLFRDMVRARSEALEGNYARDYVVPNPFREHPEPAAPHATSLDLVPPRPASNHVSLHDIERIRS